MTRENSRVGSYPTGRPANRHRGYGRRNKGGGPARARRIQRLRDLGLYTEPKKKETDE